jgi:hypothetical protein
VLSSLTHFVFFSHTPPSNSSGKHNMGDHPFLGRSESLEGLSDMFIASAADNGAAPMNGRTRSTSAPADTSPRRARLAVPPSRSTTRERQPGRSHSGSSLWSLVRTEASAQYLVDGWIRRAAFGGAAASQALAEVGSVNRSVSIVCAILTSIAVPLLFEALPPIEAGTSGSMIEKRDAYLNSRERIAYLVLVTAATALALGGTALAARNAAAATTCRPAAAGRLLEAGGKALTLPLRLLAACVCSLALAAVVRIGLAFGTAHPAFWLIVTVISVVSLVTQTGVLQGVDAVLLATIPEGRCKLS